MNRYELKHIPYGPLELETYDRLSSSFFDASQTDMHKVAKDRGILGGESLQRRFTERVEARLQEIREAKKTPDFIELANNERLEDI